jgi:hypothetical protein
MLDRDPIDLLIDSALSTYAEPGAESGLEQRILTRIASKRTPATRRRWLPFVIAFPIAACLLFFAYTTSRRGKPHFAPVEQARQYVPHVSHALTSSARPLHYPAVAVLSAAVAPAPLPRLDVFPTPYPLSPEEQALAVVSSRAPVPELKALADAQQQDDLHIAIETARAQQLNLPE